MTDTNLPHKPKTTEKPLRSSSSKNTQRHLVSNVTKANYQDVGAAFISVYGGAIIALADGESHGEVWKACPKQWGAWRAYLANRGIPIKFMDTRGKEGKCWTVPAAWPHEFDSDATVQEDFQAGEWFMRNYRPERRDLASAAQRQATAAAYKSSHWPRDQKRGTYQPEPEPKKPSFIDEDRLLESYERDMAEQAARKARPVNTAVDNTA